MARRVSHPVRTGERRTTSTGTAPAPVKAPPPAPSNALPAPVPSPSPAPLAATTVLSNDLPLTAADRAFLDYVIDAGIALYMSRTTKPK